MQAIVAEHLSVEEICRRLRAAQGIADAVVNAGSKLAHLAGVKLAHLSDEQAGSRGVVP